MTTEALVVVGNATLQKLSITVLTVLRIHYMKFVNSALTNPNIQLTGLPQE